ncbi:hypothetical protein CU048_12260 [Beijerinckiaceae bacterium]|nr:hypothetical protein CU048_12260 [Beijerinckiaceae bacterium]
MWGPFCQPFGSAPLRHVREWRPLSSGHHGPTAAWNSALDLYGIFISCTVEHSRIYMRKLRYTNRMPCRAKRQLVLRELTQITANHRCHYENLWNDVADDVSQRISDAYLHPRFCLRCDWRSRLCGDGALSQRVRQFMRVAMTFDNILGTIAIAVVMIYLVIALIRPERF